MNSLWTRLIICAAFFLSSQVRATEGGGSAYLQGTYNDFLMANLGPPGYFFRNDLYRYVGEIGPRPLGGSAQSGVKVKNWTNDFKFLWVSDRKYWGGTYGASASLPLVLQNHVDPRAPIPGTATFTKETSSRVADPYVSPLLLNWTWDRNYLLFSMGIGVPVGSYDKNAQYNLSRNTWSFDPTVSYTYIGVPSWEISIAGGIMFNTKNSDTHYQSGAELHIDWLAAIYTSPIFGLGFTGYFYEQISDDSGPSPDFLPKGFRGQGAGIGPTITHTTRFKSKFIKISGKWIGDFKSKNRFDGELFMVSASLSLQNEG